MSKDVAAMTDAMCRERDTKMEVSPIHGQAIYQSYSLKIREACQTLDPLLPSLTSSVKGLYSMLTRLARTASLHAGNLHKVCHKLSNLLTSCGMACLAKTKLAFFSFISYRLLKD